MLSTPPDQLNEAEKRERRQSPAIDPFGRSSRINARNPELSTRPQEPRLPPTPSSLFGTSRVRNDPRVSDASRNVSQGAVWNVGGSAPADDGVSSTSDGRGGRITSGTNAPMFKSAFFNQAELSDEQDLHVRRLAAAIELDQANRVLGQSTPVFSSTAPASPTSTDSSLNVWQDNEWKKPGFAPLLDAPALRDDYYCSLLAYSYTAKCLAVGLGAQVYLWSETRGVDTPDSLTSPFSGHVTSLSFSSAEGGHSVLAVGRADGRITLWSPDDTSPRFDSDQPSPVSCVCFAPRTFRKVSVRDPNCKVQVEYLLIGDEAGHVYLYSVEWPDELERDVFNWHGSMTLLARLTIHTQQICGLAWSPEGDVFASGGNDNSLYLFETRRILRPESVTAKPSVQVRGGGGVNQRDPPSGQGTVLSITPGRETHRFTMNAAVKAMAFCPWQASLLAAGGGSNDRCIHFYHTLSGAALATIDCAAQVTSLVWSRTRREIAATFGFAQPDHPIRVAVFSWPQCETVVRIPWFGEERALWSIGFPGGPDTTVEETAAATRSTQSSPAREGTPWYARRTRAEGCLVIATSDASIKFHEVWSEQSVANRRSEASGNGLGIGLGGNLGGSDILEALHGVEKEGDRVIR